MTRTTTTHPRALRARPCLLIGAIALLAGAPDALAQSGDNAENAQQQQEPDRTRVLRRKPLKRSVINLQRQASTPRDGQPMPGQASPSSGAGANAPAGAPATTPGDRAPQPIEPVIPIAPARDATGAPASPGGAARATSAGASVIGATGNLQWRADGRTWAAPRVGERFVGRLDMRTGSGASFDLRLDSGWTVRIGPMSRVAFEGDPEAGPGERVRLVFGRVELRAPTDAATPSPLTLETQQGARTIERDTNASADAFAGVQVLPSLGE